MRDRLTLAYFLAPLTTSPVLTGLVLLYTAQTKQPRELFEGIEYSLFFFSFFGIPLAYVTELLLVVGVKAIGLSPATLKRRWILALGTLGGAIVFGGLFNGSSLSGALWMGSVGAAMGAVASATFAAVRGPSAAQDVAI